MIRYCVDTLGIGFIDFVLKGKSLLECSNLFSPNKYEMNDKKNTKIFSTNSKNSLDERTLLCCL